MGQAQARSGSRRGCKRAGNSGQLTCPGILAYRIGSDLGLQEGNWSFAIIVDLTDADAYRAHDLDDAHNAARARLAAT
jgi:hypothetical protein